MPEVRPRDLTRSDLPAIVMACTRATGFSHVCAAFCPMDLRVPELTREHHHVAASRLVMRHPATLIVQLRLEHTGPLVKKTAIRSVTS
jgi:hypothetical protein